MNYTIIDNCVTTTQFKTLFTAAERITARALRDTDPQVDDMFDMLEDIRTTHVSLVLPDVIGMLEHLADVGVLTDERVYQIKFAYIPGTDNPPQWPLVYPNIDSAPESTPEPAPEGE